MYYIVESNKSFGQASTDLETAVTQNGFGVLHVHDLGATLRSKGMAFDQECKVFEVCNPAQASKVLAVDMRLNMALPCRRYRIYQRIPTQPGDYHDPISIHSSCPCTFRREHIDRLQHRANDGNDANGHRCCGHHGNTRPNGQDGCADAGHASHA